MAEVCNNVCTEPELQPLSGEALQGRSANCQEGTRVDIRAEGFWEQSQNAFFEVRIFNPFAPSNISRSVFCHIPTAWEAKEKSLWTADSRSGARFLYTHCPVSNRGDGQCSASDFQENGVYACNKAWSALQPSDECCTMHAQLLSDQVTNPVHQRLQINHGSCCQDCPYPHDCQWGACPPNLTSNNSRSNWKPTIVNNFIFHVCIMYVYNYV